MSTLPRPRASRVLGAAVLFALGATNLGCAIMSRPVALPPREQPYIAVLSGHLDEPTTMVARHSWIIANPGKGQELARYEYSGFGGLPRKRTSNPLIYLDRESTLLHGVLLGDHATIDKIMACLDVETPRYYEEHPDYFPIPGPNSNTYVDQMMRRCAIPFELPATAIGKDYRGLVGASVTAGGTGVQLETWLAGIKLGLKEGVELHILGFSIGVDFWPPAVIVPADPGRIGFDDR
jgi:hypothetical protein